MAIVAPGPPSVPPAKTDLWTEMVGKPAPEFQQIKGWLFGEPVKMADLRGKHILLHFWSVFSEQRIPELMGLQKKYADQNLVIVVVHPFPDTMTIEGVRAHIENELRPKWWGGHELPFRMALDGGGRVPIAGTNQKAEGATCAAYRIPESQDGQAQAASPGPLVGPDGRVLLSLPAFIAGTKSDAEIARVMGVKPVAPDWMKGFKNDHYRLANGEGTETHRAAIPNRAVGLLVVFPIRI